MLIEKKPLTEKQLAASRANGRKSLGPLSASRARSGQGALARTLLLPGESREKFLTFWQSTWLELQPETAIEIQLVESYIGARWRQMRFLSFENVAITREIDSPEIEGENPVNRAAAASGIVGASPSGNLMRRAELSFARQCRNTLSELMTYRAWRREEAKKGLINL